MKLYHGTSKAAYKAILANNKTVKPAFTSSNISLGGAYFTTDPKLAKVYARRTARVHGEGGEGIVFEVKPLFPLLPDEDWVVNAFEELEIDENEEIIDPKYKAFLMIFLKDMIKALYQITTKRDMNILIKNME